MKEIYLGEAIKQQRIDLGLSQEELCEGICEPITLSRLESGKSFPSYHRIKALLQRLNMPDDRYYALLSKHEVELNVAKKEFNACTICFIKASGEKKKRAWELAMEQLRRLDQLAEPDDTITRQYILSHKAALGRENGPYSLEEQLEMQLNALRLTVPNFKLEKIGGRRYSVYETSIINQIADTYSNCGEKAKALDLYRQLYDYVGKCDSEISIYAMHFSLIAHNYAQELGVQKYYHESIEIADQGKRVGVKYGYHHHLPGFLAIMGESYYHLGEEEKSKKLCVQAHYLYEVLEDERNLHRIDPDIKKRFHLEFPA